MELLRPTEMLSPEEKVLVNFANDLVSRGHEVEVLETYEKGLLRDQFDPRVTFCAICSDAYTKKYYASPAQVKKNPLLIGKWLFSKVVGYRRYAERLAAKHYETRSYDIVDAAVQIKQREIIPHNPVMKCIGLLSKLDRVKLGNWIDKLSEHYNKKHTRYVGLLTYTGKNPYTGRSGYENDLMRREWYSDPIDVDFEDSKFMTISDPIADLVHRYGPNWAAPYPEEKRITKHDIKNYTISDEVMARIRRPPK